MISLGTSAFYERATRQIGSLRSEADRLQQQVGSGSRLERSSDDPVAAARMRTLGRQERLAQVDQRNSDLAESDLKLADGALGSVANIIIRAKELATQAANGVLSAEQRLTIGSEIEGLRDNLLTIANSRNGAGHALFGGQAAGFAYVAAGDTVTYAGTGVTDPVDLGDGHAVSPALTGPQFLEFEAGGAPTDLFAVLGTFAAALATTGDQAASARDAMGALDAGLEKVTTAQTIVGARLGWIELMAERRETTGELRADEQASVGGADLATTVTRLQEIITVLEASQASFVRLSQLTLFDMLR